MKYLPAIAKLGYAIDHCECSIKRLEMKEIKKVFCYESQYSNGADTPELKSLFRRALVLIEVAA